jgi:hypothetical protein
MELSRKTLSHPKTSKFGMIVAIYKSVIYFISYKGGFNHEIKSNV